MPVVDLSLEGKIAIVTGGSKGIGRAIALAYAEHGADLVLAARRPGPLEETAAEVRALGRRCVTISADMALDADVEAVARTAMDAFGGVDILVNNAGVGAFVSIYDATAEDFLDTVRVNAWAPLLLARLCQPSMVERGGGVIINMGSAVGERATVGKQPYAAYAPSKAALHNITQMLAKAWAADKIRVLVLAPGIVDTDLVTDVLAAAAAEGRPVTPLGRAGKPEEVAGMALLMASPAGAFMTGATYLVDGGENYAE
jgi:NAD(P)-dependent dehydrogenase (short-subunit alcohol dehydrogenase family)